MQATSWRHRTGPVPLANVPAAVLRRMSAKPELNRLFLSKMTERMLRMDMVDLPRFGGLGSVTMRELRTPQAEPAAPDDQPAEPGGGSAFEPAP